MRALLTGCLALVLALAARAADPVGPPPPAGPESEGGVFVLGIDGMDPVILQRLMDEGRMPNFKRLADEGTFQELGTSNPPQSPVAWSNFVTGMNPGGHGIYDFIHRDPSTYIPIPSNTPPPGEPPATLELFGYALPLGGDALVNNRTGTPFWDYLDDAGVTTEIFRIPGNYPPTPSDALTLSGMGTVDMRGTDGTYTWYTDELIMGGKEKKADLIVVTPEDEDGDGFDETVRSILRGPPDSMRVDPVDPFVTTPLVVHISPDDDVAWIKIGGGNAIVEVGEWSEWMDVSFEVMPMMPMTGIVRFYLKELRPNFRLYASPVNIAPNAPAQPVTTPDDAAESLYDDLGHFYTQSMPEEVNAFKDGLFDDDDFLKQVRLVHKDGHAMLELALDRFDPGDMTFMYLSDIDLQCHMLWHHDDPKTPGAPRHPAYKPEISPGHVEDIEEFYTSTDAVLGRVREQLPAETMLVVMSDHGFAAYTRKVHLNAWLRDNGYLFMKDDAKTGTLIDGNIDWSRTRAYGLGFNGIYLNLAGREGEGIVDPADKDRLADEIIGKLLPLADPESGRRPIQRADKAADVYTGPRIAEAPDIVVGYAAGFGCSNESTLGETTEALFEDNLGNDFTGNHLMAPEVVPGILLVNRALAHDGNGLTDVTASLMDAFGLPVPPDMVGRSFLSK